MRYFDRNGLLKTHFMSIEMTRKYPSQAAGFEAVRFQCVEEMYKK
jgi:hypothetical protein